MDPPVDVEPLARGGVTKWPAATWLVAAIGDEPAVTAFDSPNSGAATLGAVAEDDNKSLTSAVAVDEAAMNRRATEATLVVLAGGVCNTWCTSDRISTAVVEAIGGGGAELGAPGGPSRAAEA